VIALEALNALPVEEFTTVLGAIFEHSPWVAQRAAAARPFTSRLQLLDAMRAVVQSAPAEEQLGLIRAHPQLGARGRNRAHLTEASAREQRRAGLDACTDEEFAELLRLNAAYVQKFSFPFILAVRGHTPDSILAALGNRSKNDVELERLTALTQIGLIGGYRLADVVASSASAEVLAMAERLEAAAGRPAVTAEGLGVTDVHGSVRTSGFMSLSREWMLAAGLEVYVDTGDVIGASNAPLGMVGVQPGDPTAQRLLLGAYSDPTSGDAHHDGVLGTLLGIAVAQQIRQKRLPTRFNLVLLASPAQERQGSILIHRDPDILYGNPAAIWDCMPLSPTDIDSLRPLRTAGISDRCLAITHHGWTGRGVPDEWPEVRTLEGATQALESFVAGSEPLPAKAEPRS
jgi:OHCU decarboxylase